MIYTKSVVRSFIDVSVDVTYLDIRLNVTYLDKVRF